MRPSPYRLFPDWLTRSHRIKLAVIVLLLAVAAGREVEWVRRTLDLGGYWEAELARRQAALVTERDRAQDLRALLDELETRDRAEAARVRGDLGAARERVEELRRAVAEARRRVGDQPARER